MKLMMFYKLSYHHLHQKIQLFDLKPFVVVGKQLLSKRFFDYEFRVGMDISYIFHKTLIVLFLGRSCYILQGKNVFFYVFL